MERRRLINLLPEPRFQMKFLFLLLGGCLLNVAAIGLLLYFLLHQNYELLVKYAALEPEMDRVLTTEFHRAVAFVGFGLLVFLVATAFVGLIFSHQVAGPIYALRRTIKEIMEGKPSQWSVRKGDEFADLIESFNSMVKRLGQRS